MFHVMPKPKIKNLNRETRVVNHETRNITLETVWLTPTVRRGLELVAAGGAYGGLRTF